MKLEMALLLRQSPLAGVVRLDSIYGRTIVEVLVEIVNFVRAGGGYGQMIVERVCNIEKKEEDEMKTLVDSLLKSLQTESKTLTATFDRIDDHHSKFTITVD